MQEVIYYLIGLKESMLWKASKWFKGESASNFPLHFVEIEMITYFNSNIDIINVLIRTLSL